MARKSKGQQQTLSGSPIGNFTNFSPKPIQASRSPTAADTGFEIGQLWVDLSTDLIYGLASSAGGNAVWTILGPGDSDVDAIASDSGTANPAGGIITIAGGTGVTTSASGSTITVDGGIPITPYVVGPVSTAGFTTIQAGINAANASGGGLVYIQNDTYTEDLTLFDGITLHGESKEEVIVQGTHVLPLSGNVSCRRIKFEDASAIFSAPMSSSIHLITEDCEFDVTNGHTFDVANLNVAAIVEVRSCSSVGANDGFFTNPTNEATLFIDSSRVGGGNGNTLTFSRFFTVSNSTFICPVQGIDSAVFEVRNCTFEDNFTADIDCIGNITLSFFNTGAVQAFTMNSSMALEISECVFSCAAATCIGGTGTGFLTLSTCSFLNSTIISGPTNVIGGQTKTGDVELAFPGSKLIVKGGAVTDFIGNTTLVAGSSVVSNTSISADDRIFFTYLGSGLSNTGQLSYTISAGVSFTVESTDGADANLLSYFIVRAF